MSVSNDVRVVLGSWGELNEPAAAIRFEVFVEEQQVPLEEELDVMDEQCLHALAYNLTHVPIATGRLLPDGHIGRMAVLKPYRQTGAGSAVLVALMDAALKKGLTEVVLGAQLHARNFYAKHGFIEYGDVFLDANIEHVMMKLPLL